MMARFFGTVNGRSRTSASRLGSASDPVRATARGWSVGGIVEVRAVGVVRTPGGRIKEEGEDRVSIALTGGSNSPRATLDLGDWASSDNGPVPASDRAKVILRAIRSAEKRAARLSGVKALRAGV